MKLNYIFASVLVGLSLSGCTDLDTSMNGDIVTSGQKNNIIAADAKKEEAGVNSIFAQFSQYMPVTGSRHNDFGYPAIMMLTDGNGMDVVSADNGYNWTGNDLTYDDRVYTSYESEIIWNTLYKQITPANQVLKDIPADTKEPAKQVYVAQAFAARAFDYWVLAQLYQFNYKGNEDKPCVPLITDKNTDEVAAKGAPRATVKEVYAQILSDLDSAIKLLTEAAGQGAAPSNVFINGNGNHRYIDLAVAYGIRARVNLTMQNWLDAAKDAESAIANYSGPAYTKLTGTNNMIGDVADDWMWGVIVEPSDDVAQSGIVNWPSHMGSFNYGYAAYCKGRRFNKALFNTMSSTDIRRGWVYTGSSSADSTEMADAGVTPEQFAYIKARYPVYTQMKFAPDNNKIGASTNARDIPLMRIEEMYLIQAEGLIMGGQIPEGKAVLEKFGKERDPKYTVTATSATDLQDEIWRQRRIEFWGEGLSWFDIMRLNKDVDRRGGGYPDAAYIFHIKAGSPILLWRLPEAEIQANPGLTDADNNPSASKPVAVDDNTASASVRTAAAWTRMSVPGLKRFK